MPSKKILLVDDEESIITTLHRELYPWSLENKIEIIAARTGDQALSLIEEDPANVALVISDLRMPGLSGADLLLRVCKKYPNIMTMLLTGYSDADAMIKAIEAGVFSYILKPWSRQNLLNEVKKAYEIYRIREERSRELQLLEADLKRAGKLQRSLLRCDLPDDVRVKYYTLSLPLSDFEIGGDYYDIQSLDSQRHLVLVGDVSGHGVTSALITFVLKTLIRPELVNSLIEGNDRAAYGAATLLRWLNERLCSELRNLPDIVVTMTACIIDLSTQTASIANAGNPPSFVLRENEVLTLDTTGAGISFRPDTNYSETQLDLNSKDRLLFFTNGFAEQLAKVTASGRNAAADRSEERDPFDLPTVQEMLLPLYYEEQIVPALAETVKAQAKIDSFPDDVTILAVDMQ